MTIEEYIDRLAELTDLYAKFGWEVDEPVELPEYEEENHADEDQDSWD